MPDELLMIVQVTILFLDIVGKSDTPDPRDQHCEHPLSEHYEHSLSLLNDLLNNHVL